MRKPFLSLMTPVLVAAVMAGCEPAQKAPELPPDPPRVAFSTVTRERKVELAQAVAAALTDFDDLYGKITATVEESSEGVSVVVALGEKAKAEPVDRALGVALANFEFKAPGIRYVSTGDRTWKILLPDDMQVSAEGKFDFRLP